MSGTRRVLLGAAVGAALVALVVLVARRGAEQPARCAPGMVALGPRCCGEGQRLEGSRCAGTPRRCAEGLRVEETGCVAPERRVELAGGTLRVGPGDWEAQGVVRPREATVGGFALDAYEVNEARYAACVAAGACASVALSGEPGRAVAGCTIDEAARFCAWAGGALPTSDQLAWAASGAASRRYAWGDTGAVCRRAAWGLRAGPCGERAEGPEIAGSHPDGASPEGIHDLAGNVAEWTETSRSEVGCGAACGPTEESAPPPSTPPTTPPSTPPSTPNPASPATSEIRGGSWADGEAAALRSWNRREVERSGRSPEVGFRCAYRSTSGQE